MLDTAPLLTSQPRSRQTASSLPDTAELRGLVQRLFLDGPETHTRSFNDRASHPVPENHLASGQRSNEHTPGQDSYGKHTPVDGARAVSFVALSPDSAACAAVTLAAARILAQLSASPCCLVDLRSPAEVGGPRPTPAWQGPRETLDPVVPSLHIANLGSYDLLAGDEVTWSEFLSALAELRLRYTHLIVLAPPLEHDPVALRLCVRGAGQLVLVLQSGRSRRRPAAALIEQAQTVGATWLGTVLTGYRDPLPRLFNRWL